jgi:hypothetical protein
MKRGTITLSERILVHLRFPPRHSLVVMGALDEFGGIALHHAAAEAAPLVGVDKHKPLVEPLFKAFLRDHTTI